MTALDHPTPAELRDRIHADRDGTPYLLLRDGTGAQGIIALDGEQARLTVGRAPGCEVHLAWDPRVSGAHAELVRLGDRIWAVVDDGVSRNGTFVNGERVVRRRRLGDGDVLRFGDTVVRYRAPRATIPDTQTVTPGELQGARLSPAQRRVLVALCRPLLDDGHGAAPAGNQAIAAELVVSVDTVKDHLRSLFAAFGVGDLPRATKRLELARRALAAGAVGPRDG